MLCDAALRYAQAEDDAEWEAAWHALRMAARRYVLADKPGKLNNVLPVDQPSGRG